MIWQLFSCERAPIQLLQKVLILTRRMLKRGFPRAELVECGSPYWPEASCYPSSFVDPTVRQVFAITAPLILDTILRTKNAKYFSSLTPE